MPTPWAHQNGCEMAAHSAALDPTQGSKNTALNPKKQRGKNGRTIQSNPSSEAGMPAPRTPPRPAERPPDRREQGALDLRGHARRSRRIWSGTEAGGAAAIWRGGGGEEERERWGFGLGWVQLQTRREPRPLARCRFPIPQSLYSPKVKGGGGELGEKPPRGERKRTGLEREGCKLGRRWQWRRKCDDWWERFGGGGVENGREGCVGPPGMVNLGVFFNFLWRVYFLVSWIASMIWWETKRSY